MCERVTNLLKDAYGVAVQILLLCIMLLWPAVAAAQWTFAQGQAPVTGDPSPLFSVQAPRTCSDGTQTLPDGGYLKRNPTYPTSTPFVINTVTHNEGTCLAYLYQIYNHTDLHAINYISYSPYMPGSSHGGGPLTFWAWNSPSPKPLDYDSRNPIGGAQGPYTESGFYYLGTWRMTFWSTNEPTGCGFVTTSHIVEKTINVVSCKPSFSENPNGTIMRLPTGTISIYVPDTMSYLFGPVDNAVADLTTKLVESGITLTRNLNSPCTTGGNCINFNEGSIPAGACAEYTKFPDPDTGINVQPAKITFPTDAAGRTPSRLQRSVLHELGHLLGLNDQPNVSGCGINDSVMVTAALDCNAQSGFISTPTLNDSVPINKTSFGNGPKISCGF
jgi:hypothetical protein